MFEKLKKLYEQGEVTKAGLRKAVRFRWITAEQYEEITGEKY